MDSSQTAKARLLASVTSMPSPARAGHAGRPALLVAISVGIAAVLFESLGGFAYSAARPWQTTAELAGGWALACVPLSAAVLWRPRAVLPRKPWLMFALALGTPIALFAWMQVFAGTYVEPFSRLGLRCIGFTLAAAAVPLSSFLLMRRGVEPRRPMALGAAIGAICGAWASVAVAAWCPLTNAIHALTGHVAPVVLLAFLGAIVGERQLGLRHVGG
jgi:hypothetical protein